MSALPPPKPVRELAAIDRQVFEDEVRPAGQPVVLRGLAAEWPAVQAARRSPEEATAYLLSFGPDKLVPALIGAPEIGGRFFYDADLTGFNFTRVPVPLPAFFDRLLRERSVQRPYALAVQSEVIPELLPGFAEAHPAPLVPADVAPRVWIGNAIRVAPHFDLKENVGVVVAGRRRFTLFPPEQLPNLYMGPMELTPAGTPVSLVDLAAPDLDRFPRYAEAAAHARVAELEEGDAIYIPFHWWHAVDSLASVNVFVNYWWNPVPDGLGRPYDALLHALYAFAALPEDQRAVWRMVFDNLVFGANGEPLAHVPPQGRGILGRPDAAMLGRMRATLKDILRAL